MKDAQTAIINGWFARLTHTALRNRRFGGSAGPRPSSRVGGMRWLAASVLAVCLTGLALHPAANGAEGFVTLFNGQDFTNWKVPENDGGHWKIVDGVIDYDAESEAGRDKNLWSVKEYGDFVFQVDWRIKETPYVNPRVPYILRDGTHALDIKGEVMRMSLPDSDSGILLRGQGKSQINIWCWPVGSGEVYGYRMDRSQPPEVRAGVTPLTQADNPVGEWNRFEITMIGDRVTVFLNGTKVLDNALLPGIPARGPIGLQHHGSKRDGKWVSPPALVQFKNISIKELGM